VRNLVCIYESSRLESTWFPNGDISPIRLQFYSAHKMASILSECFGFQAEKHYTGNLKYRAADFND